MAPPPLQKQYMSGVSKEKKPPVEPRPSSSVLLLSSNNEILLLHRVKTSSTFASAHVFPGGNLEKSDGSIPPATSPSRHVDSEIYRTGAIRECFEESGILLAKHRSSPDSTTLLHVEPEEMERARKEIHAGKLDFVTWVEGLGGVLDREGLYPFTRWITPPNLPKRFTTQMYIYFLPSSKDTGSSAGGGSLTVKKEALIPIPTSDGGVEHTAAQFASADEWLAKASRNEIILFPPQFYLMNLLAPLLAHSDVAEARQKVLEFLKTDGDGKGILWQDKVMSPLGLFLRKSDGRSVLALDKPGLELEGSGRGGDTQRVVLVKFSKDGPRNVEVRERKEVLDEERRSKETKI